MTTPTQNLRPCPFCGSERLRIDPMLFCDDDGEQPGVECLDCDGMNRLEMWNLRVLPKGVSTWTPSYGTAICAETDPEDHA